jgi:uncharacterized protein
MKLLNTVHKFEIGDTKIVLDINSGAVYLIDDITYDVLDYYGELLEEEIIAKLKHKYAPAKIKEVIGELNELKASKSLFTEFDYEPIVKRIEGNSTIKALCLNIAHDCNLSCYYCFASDGHYKGKRELMPFSVAKEAVRFLVLNSGGIKNLEIDFFGGEPLLNFDTVKETVSYARSLEREYNKKFHFTITTNCTLLDDDMINYLHKNMDNIVLSIDGRKEINDAIRVRRDGSGTYDSIIDNIKKVVELRERDNKDYFVRGTFTKYNLDFCQDVLHLADLGFKEISVEPVVADGKEEYMFTESDLPRIHEEYEKLACEYLRRKKTGKAPFEFYHFKINLYKGPCQYRRISACGAGREYLAVVPNGDIYPCHQFVGNPKFVMGNVFEKVLEESIWNQFKKLHIYSKQECPSCWARFFCSGGCNANNFNINGDISKPYKLSCELQKKRIECAVFLSCKEKLEADSPDDPRPGNS